MSFCGKGDPRKGEPMKSRVQPRLTSALKIFLVVCLAVALGSGLGEFTKLSEAQDQLSTMLQTLFQLSTLLADPPPDGAQEELPGMGSKFELFGSGANAQDPDNPTNDVISTQLDLISNFFGGAIRRLP